MRTYKSKCTTLIVIILLLGCLVPITIHAHDDKPDSPEGVIEPPQLPPPAARQTLYHIDPVQSQAQYRVQERYVGLVDGRLVVGQTNGIEGDVLIDWDNPAQSLLGMVTVHVEQLISDSKQRDRQIRNSYLESTLYPQATMIPDPDQLFPNEIAIGEPISFVLHSYLTVHDVTVLTDWQVELTIEPDRIVGSATTDILMSDFGVGPISIVRLLSTEDDMQLVLNFVATADGAISTTDATVSTTNPTTSTQTDIDFTTTIQPILETKCVGCHLKGEIGHGIFPMSTVGDIVEYADDLALVIQTGFMPPWPPSHLAPAFHHDRSLRDEEKTAVLAWIAAGAPTTVALDAPLEDKAPSGQTLREDLVLGMPEPYVPTGEVTDDYRCFLLDPQLPNGGFVTGSNVIPGDRRVVHHVIIFQASADSRAEAVARSAEDERPGWECFGGPGLSTAELGAIGNSLGIWAPGSEAWETSEGTGVQVPPNGLIVLQVHYNYAAEFYPDQTEIALQVEAADSGLIPLRGLLLVAPVEIPCPAGSTNAACDRETALAQQDLFGQNTAAQLLRACGKEVSDYAGETAVNATTSCDWQIPIDGELTEIGGHMHKLGKSLRVTLNPDGNSPLILQDLPLWDFNWQTAYQFETPIRVKEGDILRITCTWDNSQHDNPADARYITWGEETKDEMCLSIPRIKPAAGFEELAGRAFFVSTLTNYPDWMPVWGRVLLITLRSMSGGNLLLAVLAIVGAIAMIFYRLRPQKQLSLQK